MVHAEAPERGHAANEDTPDSAGAASKRQPGATRLAAALGLDRRTIYKLREVGAPAEYDEAKWRTWIRDNRPRLKLRPSLDLAADAPRGTDVIDDLLAALDPSLPARAAPPTASPPSSDAETPTNEKLRAETRVRDLQAHKLRLEIDEQEHRLLSREDVAKVFATFAADVVNGLVDLPARAIGSMPDLPTEYRKPLRRGVEVAVAELRDQVANQLKGSLRKALWPKGSARG